MRERAKQAACSSLCDKPSQDPYIGVPYTGVPLLYIGSLILGYPIFGIPPNMGNFCIGDPYIGDLLYRIRLCKGHPIYRNPLYLGAPIQENSYIGGTLDSDLERARMRNDKASVLKP